MLQILFYKLAALYFPKNSHVNRKKQVKWYGHVKRMADTRLPKVVQEWEVQGQRRRGCV